MAYNFLVERAIEDDLEEIAGLNRECFPDDNPDFGRAYGWIKAHFVGTNLHTYFVGMLDERMVGYIQWTRLGGFRNEAVLELDDIGVTEEFRGKGFGTQLIQKSLIDYVEHTLKPAGETLRLVKVGTGASNDAQRVYRTALGAEVSSTDRDVYDGDEVNMFARKAQLEQALGISL
jgi:GNAT superfamily N-acetyltransferase